MANRTGRKAKEVERIVLDFERSGLKRREYSEQHGIAAPTLDWYRRRVRSSRAAVNLIPVRLRRTATAPSPVNSFTPGGFGLVLDNGRRIETGWGFDEASLARLIRIAGAA